MRAGRVVPYEEVMADVDAIIDTVKAPMAASYTTSRDMIPDPVGGSFMTILHPKESAKPLKTNETKKCRNHRQKSSKVVKTPFKPLISLKIE
jgi:hypothetical protein